MTVTAPAGSLGDVARSQAALRAFLHGLPGVDQVGAEQRAAIRDEIKSQQARDRNTLFETGIREALIKQGKIKIHQEVINRLIGTYRAG